MKDISEVRKAMDTTQEMFEPLHQMIVMLKQHGVDVSGVEVAEKDVQVCAACDCVIRSLGTRHSLVRCQIFLISLSTPTLMAINNHDFCLSPRQ